MKEKFERLEQIKKQSEERRGGKVDETLGILRFFHLFYVSQISTVNAEASKRLS